MVQRCSHIVLTATAAVISMSCCANSSPTPPGSLPAASSYPVIVQLVSRSQTITIRAGPNGPLYSATLPDGTRMFGNLTLEDLRAQHPALYRQLESGIAVDSR